MENGKSSLKGLWCYSVAIGLVGLEMGRVQEKHKGEEGIGKDVKLVILLNNWKAGSVDGVGSEIMKRGNKAAVEWIWKVHMVARKVVMCKMIRQW